MPCRLWVCGIALLRHGIAGITPSQSGRFGSRMRSARYRSSTNTIVSTVATLAPSHGLSRSDSSRRTTGRSVVRKGNRRTYDHPRRIEEVRHEIGGTP
jgi:hypothetical protein